MPLDLADYESGAKAAVKAFWGSREAALSKQVEAGAVDAGSRGAVTGGKTMDGFLEMARALVEANGLARADIHTAQRVMTLPGFSRPAKLWDMIVMQEGALVAVLEFKSQVGPSFGNNFNNRAEEAVGSAHDFWTAYREGAFGTNAPRSFLGWVMLLEDCGASRRPVANRAPHFGVDPVFEDASYAARYDALCRRLVQEGLYTGTAFLTSGRGAIEDGRFASHSDLTALRGFVTALAGHVAGVAARGRM